MVWKEKSDWVHVTDASNIVGFTKIKHPDLLFKKYQFSIGEFFAKNGILLL